MVDFILQFLNSISVTRDSDLVSPHGFRNEGRERWHNFDSEVLLSLPADLRDSPVWEQLSYLISAQ